MTNPNVGLNFEITFLNQHLDLSIFYPNLGSNIPALFRVYMVVSTGFVHLMKVNESKTTLDPTDFHFMQNITYKINFISAY